MIEMRAQAQAAAIRIISEALGGENSSEAAKLAVAREVRACLALIVFVCCHVATRVSFQVLTS